MVAIKGEGPRKEGKRQEDSNDVAMQVCEGKSRMSLSFFTQFPSSKRPYYVMEDADDPGFAFCFDLLFRGIEITTGGRRIHD